MDIPELETTDQIMEGLVREYIHFNKNFKMIKQINKITNNRVWFFKMF